MSIEELNNIYNNAKSNSIGPEKKVLSNRTKKSIPLKIAIGALVATLALSSLTGCAINKKYDNNVDTQVTESIKYENEYNGYKDTEIGIYERLRFNDLMEQYNFTDYEMKGNKKEYNYTKEDFQTIEELDETYLYAAYIVTTKETFNNILNALGYENLGVYLVSKGYVDESGKPDLFVWCIKNMEDISLIMKTITEEKELSK
jgi:hypothetical protein